MNHDNSMLFEDLGPLNPSTHIKTGIDVWVGGGVLSLKVLLCFGPKKLHLFHSCDPPIKNFPVFALDPIRPYFD